ncbi:flavin monoamine oxidase family protein [Roseiflexus castenholzii]|uniref:flavin monoamine oxidase family protein n=1 Tax=Roseiflexus castenholzii TaxID=120962 RepID=UPI0006749C0B
MNRRSLLKLLLSALTSASLPACAGIPDPPDALRPTDVPGSIHPSAPPAQSTADVNTDPAARDVIIVGAGIAGLRAAQTLQQHGRRVLVLEGRNRIGGRIWTDESTGMPLDLGASWIHGTQGNPIATIADQLNATLIATTYDDVQRFDPTGNPLTNNLNDRIDALLERSFARARAHAEEQNSDISLQAALEAVLDQEPLDAHDLRLLNYAINTVFEHEYAADSSQLSMRHFDHQKELNGGDAIFGRGYRVIIDFLAHNLDIRSGHIVQRVAYADDGVTVVTAHGALRAHAALITVPLGVLQRGGIVFDPPLPSSKQRAIERMGMGLLNKCYLIFPEVFWGNTTLLGYVGERKGEWAEWLNLNTLLGIPVLLGFNAATFARTIEAQSDASIIQSAMRTLRIIYGTDIPQPVDYRMTRWAADPFASGSYSFLATGAAPNDYDTLAQPVGKRLFFAGEHTHRDYPATVHGAYLSGERAANEMLSTNDA